MGLLLYLDNCIHSFAFMANVVGAEEEIFSLISSSLILLDTRLDLERGLLVSGTQQVVLRHLHIPLLIPGVLQVTVVVGHVPDVSTQVISSKIKPHHCLTGAWSSLSNSFLNLSFSTSIPASFFNFTLHSFLFRRTFKMCWVLLQ